MKVLRLAVFALLAGCPADPPIGPAPESPADVADITEPDVVPVDAGSDAGARQDVPPPVSPQDTSETQDDAGVDPDVPRSRDDTGRDGPVPVWDLALATDTSDLDCTLGQHSTVLEGLVMLDLWEVSYTSWESIDGTLQPITIRAFAAKPAAVSTLLPAVVQSHGLDGHAEADHATGTAALLSAFVLAYTGPGGGTEPNNTSEGLASGHGDGYRMFDTLPDPRGSWFWAHTMAAMRGLTCATEQVWVDSERLGITGFSAGGVATLMASAVDPRIKAGVSLSASGAWDVATESPDAWQHSLLTAAGLDIASEQWTALLESIDAEGLLPTTPSASVMMVNGTSDEFFPLTAHVTTYDAIPDSVSKRTSFAGNFDHGCYLVSGGEAAQTIEGRAELRAKGAQRLWFHHHFGTDPRYAHVPAAPQVTTAALGPATQVSAVVDPGGSQLEIDSVEVWWSNDNAFLWGAVPLKDQGGGVWAELALFPTVASTIRFVDVVYETKGLLPERFSISSRPEIPDGLVPHIRGITSCL